MKTDPHAFKAYDIRGLVPTALNTDFALALGRAGLWRDHRRRGL